MTRTERVAQIGALRKQGLMYREIAERIGISKSTVHEYWFDPTGEKTRERKARRSGSCVDCGTTVTNSGSEPGERCKSCARIHAGDMDVRRNVSDRLLGCYEWSDEEILAVARRIAVNGKLTKPMWVAAHEADPEGVPSFQVWIRRWDTWGALVAAAGLRNSRAVTGPYRNRTPPGACVAWLQRCADDLGRVPPVAAYDEWRKSHPEAVSNGTIRNRCGSWMAACEQVNA